MNTILKRRYIFIAAFVVTFLIHGGLLIYNKYKPVPSNDKGYVSLELNGIINEYTKMCTDLKDLIDAHKNETDLQLKQIYIAQIGYQHNELSLKANEYNSKSETKINILSLDEFSKLSIDEILKLSF